MSSITLLHSHQLDFEKWDRAIIKSSMPIVYGLSTFYKHLCPRWAGLVLGDYEAVMPLPFHYKGGFIPYAYQPPFIQQSGLFAPKGAEPDLLTHFLKAIPKSWVRTHLHLNYANTPPGIAMRYMTPRVSYEINLNRPFNEIEQQFNKDAVKNLKRFRNAYSQQIEIRHNAEVSTEEIVALYRRVYGKQNPFIQPRHYEQFLLLAQDLELNGKVEKIGIYNNNKPWALALFWKAMGRIHYAMGAPSPEGRKYAVTHFVIAEMLRRHAQTPCYFDFEGSSIPNVAQFYKKFGSTPRYFYTWTSAIPAPWALMR